MASTPTQANAGFFSNLISAVIGSDTQASEIDTPSSDMNNNSQTMALLETSIDPNMKNTENYTDVIIDNDEALLPTEGLIDKSEISFEKSSLSDQINVYTIKEGDTLSDIADKFDVSINTIRWENNITGQKISVGQKLNILPVTGVKHIIKSGDTISKIADKYDADAEDIYIFNGIEKTDKLKQGDIVFIPNGIIKAAAVVSKPSSSGSSSSSSNTKAPSGYYLRPVPGRVTSPYGSRHGSFHPGVDLAGVKGVTPVAAAADGVVTEVVKGCIEGKKSCGGGYGNHIEIAHPNGTTTRYAHLSKTEVKIGESISQGETVGTLGNTGSSTGPHLHFEVINANGSKMRPPV